MEITFKILIADSDSSVHSALKKPFFKDVPEAKMFSAQTPEICRHLMKSEKFQFILLDISFGPGDASGLTLLPEFRKAQPDAKIIMLSAHDDQVTVINCMQSGANDFISKRDFEVPTLTKIIRGFIDAQNEAKQDEAKGQRLANLVGAKFVSEGMRRVFALAVQAQRAKKTTVLITGETGVGKDVVANAIAAVDEKRSLVTVDCGAIAETVAESELFGHERGSFTGAERTTLGKFRAAQGGDLFLDEIGNLKRSIQDKLLRALQNKEITPVGGKSVKVNTRVIAATNEDLESKVANGDFRKDLNERLKGIVIHIPPLRERPEDIPEIADAIIASSEKPALKIAPACMSLLTAYSWPGNVRELQNTMNSVIAASTTGPITVRQLPQQFMKALAIEMKIEPNPLTVDGPMVRVDIPLESDLSKAQNHFLKEFILARHKYIGSPISGIELASKLKISRNTLRTYVKRLGINFQEVDA